MDARRGDPDIQFSRGRICLLIIVQLTIVVYSPYVAYVYTELRSMGSGPDRLPVR